MLIISAKWPGDYGIHVFIVAIVCTCNEFVSLQDNPVTGKKADVIQAAYIASEIAHRMLKPGGEVCSALLHLSVLYGNYVYIL